MPAAIQMRNFGPIERAHIELRPLTMFIGPNNAGKSVAAMLVYAATQAASPAVGLARQAAYVGGPRLVLRDATHIAEDLLKMHEAFKKGTTPHRPRKATLSFVRRTTEWAMEQYVRALERQIERCFSTHLANLGRVTLRTAHRPQVTVSDARAGWSATVTVGDEGRSKTAHAFRRKPGALLEDVARSMPRHLVELGKRARVDGGRFFINEAARFLCHRLFTGFPTESYYLPAERSGILQSHRALASFVVRQSPFVGIEEIQVPRMSGVISDFIGNLLQIDNDQESQFSGLAAELEKTLLGGGISIKADATGYPDVSYRSGPSDFPLHRASSMVSEVAPIVLYLRYLLDPGEMLIIEEPESHLHPRSQVAVAGSVVDMVGDGLRVLLTTHSDYFLNHINNAIRVATLRDGRDGKNALAFEEVAAYLFAPHGRSTVVRPVEVSPTDGVSDAEFARVAEELYDETVRLANALDA